MLLYICPSLRQEGRRLVEHADEVAQSGSIFHFLLGIWLMISRRSTTERAFR